MDFKEESYLNYVYVVASLTYSDDQQKIDYILKKAETTSKKVNQKYLNGQLCSPHLKKLNNIGGILAEEVVKEYIKFLIQENSIDAEILDDEFTDYESHRDIKVRVGKIIKTIEIRSSFNYLAKLEGVLSGKFSLLGKYVTSYKSYEPEKDFYITVIHRYKNEEIGERIKSKVNVFIIGGASKEKFKEIGVIDKEKLKQNKATYNIISPIIKADNVPRMFKEILEIS